jgi:hypothetical protein
MDGKLISDVMIFGAGLFCGILISAGVLNNIFKETGKKTIEEVYNQYNEILSVEQAIRIREKNI